METEMPMKKQSKRKPYMCALCSRAFSKALSLQRHMEDIHNIQETDSEDEDDDDDNGEEVKKDSGGKVAVMSSDHLKLSSTLCYPSGIANSPNHGILVSEHSLNDIDTPSQHTLLPQHQMEDTIVQRTVNSGQSQQTSSSKKDVIEQDDGCVTGGSFVLGCRIEKLNHHCGNNNAVIGSHLLSEKNWILDVSDQSAAHVEVDLEQGCKDILAEAASAADIFSQIREEKSGVGRNQIHDESVQESRIPAPPCSTMQGAQDEKASESMAVSPGLKPDSNEQPGVIRQHQSSAQSVTSARKPKRNLKEFIQIGKSDRAPSKKQQPSKDKDKQKSTQIETAQPKTRRQKSVIEVSRDCLSGVTVSHESGGFRTLRRSPRNTMQARSEKAVCDLASGKELHVQAACKPGSPSSGKHRQHKTLQQKILDLQKANEETRKQSLSVSKLLGRDSVNKCSKGTRQTRSTGKVKDVGLTNANVGNEEEDGAQEEKDIF
ncbi:uncharacterized protein [Diadema setosum]|uniref:uncharacterized protein n=1 Tax=Diadema setosum TaxID=31175 RepID=UPI003B3AB8DF